MEHIRFKRFIYFVLNMEQRGTGSTVKRPISSPEISSTLLFWSYVFVKAIECNVHYIQHVMDSRDL
jgi:hypothetical protein